jgi:hypothetical protein
MDCIICYEGGETINTACCTQKIHQKCLDQWLYRSNSYGRCCFCRQPSSMPTDPMPMPMDPMNSWNNPRGFIYVTNSMGSCEITAESNLAGVNSVPIIHKVESSDIETCPEEFLDSGHIIIITEDGEFLDTLNVPTGWITCINGQNTSMQLSAWLRLDT